MRVIWLCIDVVLWNQGQFHIMSFVRFKQENISLKSLGSRRDSKTLLTDLGEDQRDYLDSPGNTSGFHFLARLGSVWFVVDTVRPELCMRSSNQARKSRPFSKTSQPFEVIQHKDESKEEETKETSRLWQAGGHKTSSRQERWPMHLVSLNCIYSKGTVCLLRSGNDQKSYINTY